MFQYHQPTLNALRIPIGRGTAGIFDTVCIIRQIIDESKINPVIIGSAISCIFNEPEKSPDHEICAIFEFVRDHVRYTRDPVGVEAVTWPETTLLRRVGDCDDQVTLLGALLESVGILTRTVITGYNGPSYEHIYLQAWNDRQWVDLDPTENFPMGYAPPNPTVIKFEDR